MATSGAETFAPGGRITGVLGLLIVAAIVLIDLLDFNSVPLPVVSGALVLGVLGWTTMLRPQVSARDGVLVLRNAFETVRIPLAAVEDLTVRQVLAVRTVRRRYIASGVGRSVRQAVQGRPAATPRSGQQVLRPTLGPGFGGDAPSQVEPGMAYADWVELRLRDLAQADREARGIRAYSEEADALADEVTRTPAVPELAALGAATVFFVVAVLLALL